MEKDFGIKDEDYIRKHKLSVVMTDERNHARKALVNHINKKYKPQKSHYSHRNTKYQNKESYFIN